MKKIISIVMISLVGQLCQGIGQQDAFVWTKRAPASAGIATWINRQSAGIAMTGTIEYDVYRSVKNEAILIVPASPVTSVYDIMKIAWDEAPLATSYTVYRRILETDSWVALPLFATNITVLNQDDNASVVGPKYMYYVRAFNDPAVSQSTDSSSLAGGKTDISTVSNKGDPATFETNAYKGEKIYQITVPAGMSRLIVTLEGGTGDCDLYGKLGSYPTTDVYNARGLEIMGDGNREVLTVANPAAGTWYILLSGASAAGYANVQFSATYYGATDIVLTQVPADNQEAPFTAAFTGQVQDETATGIPGLTVGVRDPVTGLTTWLAKTDSYGNFTYYTVINADGEYTFDFYITAIPDSTPAIGSWTVKTKRIPKESNGFFDFSGYLAGTRIPVATIETQGGTLAGLEEYMNARRGFADGPVADAITYENIWLTNTLASVSTDTKITLKLDAGLYLLFYGTEGAAVGNGPAKLPASLLASPFLVRVSPAKQPAVITNLKANGLIDNAVADNVENGGMGVVIIAAVNNAYEHGTNYDYDISLYASEQLELLENIAGNNEVELNIATPEKKYGADTIAKFVNVTLDDGRRKIGVAVSSFSEKIVPAP